jgi:hypothetical protein
LTSVRANEAVVAEDYPANPMNLMQDDSPDFEDQLFDFQSANGEKSQAISGRSEERQSGKI